MLISIGSLARLGLWIVTAMSWATVLFFPVNWPVSSMPANSAVIPIGPVSSFVVAGQSFRPSEAVSSIDLLIRVGGPFGSSSPITLSVYNDIDRVHLIAQGTASPVSVPGGLAVTRFELDTPLADQRLFYLELDIPPTTPWPILVGGTRSDPEREGEQLYLMGKPGWSDQDLAYQLFRKQSAIQRFLHLMGARPEMGWTITLSLLSVIGISTGISTGISFMVL
jgi:hypothetical protein